MAIDILDPEYAIPGELDRPCYGGRVTEGRVTGGQQYDLRTYDQRADARLDDHQRRIAELEQRVAWLERVALTPGFLFDEAPDLP
ncbi:MAG: hypothetical protein BroJett021_28080 [Chloroflexota bacterium]|nr:MAG: hypothetical protein BroJett021_28080 [Chloroflexota bacterium]